MERQEANFRMPGAYKSPSMDTSISDGTSTGSGNATSAVDDQAPTAAAMRASNANLGNPRGHDFEVAGPSIGSTSIPHLGGGNTAFSREHPSKNWDNNSESSSSGVGIRSRHARRSSLSGTLNAGVANAATRATAAGNYVLAAARKRINANDDKDSLEENGDHDRYDNKDGISSSSSHTGTQFRSDPMTSDKVSNQYDLHQLDIADPPHTISHREGSPKTTAIENAPLLDGRSNLGAAVGTAGDGKTTIKPSIKRIPIAQPPPNLHEHSARMMLGSSSRSGHSAAPKVAAATIGTAAMSTGAVAMHHHGKDTTITEIDSMIDKVKNFFHNHHSSHGNIYSSNTYEYALTKAQVLKKEQGYAVRHHKHLVPIWHNSSTIATTSASPEFFENEVDYVPETQAHHCQQRQHHHRLFGKEQPFDSAKGFGFAVAATAAATTVGASTAACMGSKKMQQEPLGKSKYIVDATLPPAPNQHTAYIPVSVVKPNQPAEQSQQQPRQNVFKLATNKPPVVESSVPVSAFDTTYMSTGTERHATHPRAIPTSAATTAAADTASGIAAYLGDKRERPFRQSVPTTGAAMAAMTAIRPLAERTPRMDTVDQHMYKQKEPSHHQIGIQTGTAAATGVVTAGTAVLANRSTRLPNAALAATKPTMDDEPHHSMTEKIREAMGLKEEPLTFTDPETLHSITENRTMTIDSEASKPSLKDKILDAIHHPAEHYGPADPSDLELTKPKMLRPPSESAAVPGTAGAAAAAADTGALARHRRKVMQSATPNTAAASESSLVFTNPHNLRPLSGVRTIPIENDPHEPSLKDKIKNILHTFSEYGPADPKDLKLTDPITPRPFGENLTTPSAIATAPVVAGATSAIAHHHKPAQGPTTPNATMMTGARAPRPEARIRTISVEINTHRNKEASQSFPGYSPSDSKDMKLTSPKTPRTLGEKHTAPTVTGAATTAAVADAGTAMAHQQATQEVKPDATAAGSKPMFFTDPHALRPLVGFA
ncbi:MAG: hypothetical protein J3Q66DRAFT_389025 [Benniella sp.]|nr:MAG: hypothetical protein J3Q66DRAFT_389025 [Benniella sp.]